MEVPAGTSASRAWFGQIRPFKNDDDARKLLRLLERFLSSYIQRRGIGVSCQLAISL